jgi:hypothetical protein
MINEILFRLNKMLSIFFIANIFAIPAIFTTLYLNNFYNKNDDNDKSLLLLFIELLLIVGLYAIITYILRNISQMIPYPLDGYFNFNYSKVKERNNSSGYTALYLIAFSNVIYNKMNIIRTKLKITN